ncbi:EamA family transporter [Puniceibacterium sp. IMCC21224]|uniref:EamA family transporter n=1 Tax=Puniceibacterium sp. IMCC21224 TaxID=1618204 RepID=UPI00065D5C50|nr:EamA family transporter [Puniceibacterium sp. IMCC21224]KMK66703.1 EamA-like transporter family [Puniceibacterium sp. IMCC21224]
MSLFALGIVLFAAVMHASWNAMVKAVPDRAAVLAGVSGCHALIGIVLIWMSPSPDPASWPMIVISAVVHYGYYLLLFYSYRFGDLSQVYPISRGMAPPTVALMAFLLVGETLPVSGWFGLGAVCLGISILALQRGAVDARRSTVLLALCLGICISTYSVADGIGVRLSDAPLGYIGWLFVLEAPVPMAIIISRGVGGGRFELRPLLAGLLAGVLAGAAYGLVLYVKTFSPLAAVSAVRESSVIIAALIGVVLFGERPWKGRLAAAVIVGGGVIALSIG